MADIRVEEKKSGSILPWILGVVGLVLLAWLAVDLIDKDGEPELFVEDEVNFPDGDFSDRESDLINAMDQPDAIQETDFNGNGKSALIVSDDNLHKITGQLEEMVDEVDMENDPVIKAEMAKLMAAKERVYESDDDNDRTDLQMAAVCASKVVERVVQQKYPEMRNQVGTIVAAVNRDDLDEEDFLKFYDDTRLVLKDMEDMGDANERADIVGDGGS